MVCLLHYRRVVVMRFLVLLAVALAVWQMPKVSATVWPMPAHMTTGSHEVIIAPPKIDYDTNNEIVSNGIKRYLPLIFPHEAFGPRPAWSMSIVVTDEQTVTKPYPEFGMDESYELTVPSDGDSAATITAKTQWGVLRGLETFSQLVTFDFDKGWYVIKGTPIQIQDSPRFAHRGLMVDTARHYETLASLRGIIDSLPYSKFNVLHWHMSDTQSFPLQSLTYPKLWDGSWSDTERYTQGDVAGIVEYARARGVRVMVEFDMPGHAAAWCAGYPEVCPSTTCQQPLNVANNATFSLIESLLGECTGKKSSTPGHPHGLFPDHFIHLGGDEVDTSCWTKTPAVNSWLEGRNMTADQGYAYFVKRAAEIALAQGRRPVQWSEVFDHFKGSLDKKTIVHIWKSVTNVTEVVALGYDTLVNVGYNAKSWYLDNLNVQWDAVYSNEPCDGVPDDLCNAHVIGGHGEMWGETVDASDLEQTVWPRLAAIGERLWSPRGMTNTTAALPRIENFRCLLNTRGVRSAPVTNANARSSPSGPGSCHDQRRTELFIGKHSEKQSKANGAQQMSLAESHLGTICFLVSMAAIAGFVLGSGFTALGFKFGKSVWLTGRVKPQAEPTTPEEEGLLASTDMDASDDYSGVPPAGSHQIL